MSNIKSLSQLFTFWSLSEVRIEHTDLFNNSNNHIMMSKVGNSSLAVIIYRAKKTNDSGMKVGALISADIYHQSVLKSTVKDLIFIKNANLSQLEEYIS